MHRQRVVNIWPRRSLPRSGRGHAPLDRAAQVAPPRTAPLRLMLGVDGALTQMTPEQPSPVGSNVSHSAIRRLRMVRDMPAPAQPRRSFRCRISAPRPPHAQNFTPAAGSARILRVRGSDRLQLRGRVLRQRAAARVGTGFARHPLGFWRTTAQEIGHILGQNVLSDRAGSIGGARRDRTADLLHAMQALSQLSYGPTEWAAKVRKGRRAVKEQRALILQSGAMERCSGASAVAQDGLDPRQCTLPAEQGQGRIDWR